MTPAHRAHNGLHLVVVDDTSPASSAEHGRPRRRADCANGIRPCPFVGCRHNLFLVVDHRGLLFARVGREPWNIARTKSCALDVADLGGLERNQVAALLGITREYATRIEVRALRKLAADPVMGEWARALLARSPTPWQTRAGAPPRRARTSRSRPRLAHARAR